MAPACRRNCRLANQRTPQAITTALRAAVQRTSARALVAQLGQDSKIVLRRAPIVSVLVLVGPVGCEWSAHGDKGPAVGGRSAGGLPARLLGQGHHGRWDSAALGWDRADLPELRRGAPARERDAGTIEKYIEDVVTAVFGLPQLHEDDRPRAARAAAQMREAPSELNVKLRARYGVILENRTGVSTGEVVGSFDGFASLMDLPVMVGSPLAPGGA